MRSITKEVVVKTQLATVVENGSDGTIFIKFGDSTKKTQVTKTMVRFIPLKCQS